MRAVLDPNILISSLLSRHGAPAALVSRWLSGDFELVVSETLLGELARVVAYPKLRTRIEPADATRFIELLRRTARVAPDEDPATLSHRSTDPGDDYLIALAAREHAVLVSGDSHLLELADRLPIRTARAYVDELDSQRAQP